MIPTSLGNDYTNDIFVGDANHGDLYYFEVNEDRFGLKLGHPSLSEDLIASNEGREGRSNFWYWLSQ